MKYIKKYQEKINAMKAAKHAEGEFLSEILKDFLPIERKRNKQNIENFLNTFPIFLQIKINGRIL